MPKKGRWGRTMKLFDSKVGYTQNGQRLVSAIQDSVRSLIRLYIGLGYDRSEVFEIAESAIGEMEPEFVEENDCQEEEL